MFSNILLSRLTPHIGEITADR